GVRTAPGWNGAGDDARVHSALARQRVARLPDSRARTRVFCGQAEGRFRTEGTDMSVTESMTAQRKATWRSVITPSTIALVLMGLAVVWTLGSSYRQDIVVMGAVYALVALGMYLPFNL